MLDQYTEVQEDSAVDNWLVSLIIAPLFGVLLLGFSLKYQVDNEHAAAEMKGALKATPALVAELTPATAPKLEGNLVHLSGVAHPSAPVCDVITGAAYGALVLNRKVEVYQWDEDYDSDTQKKFGGGSRTVRTYKYNKIWSEQLKCSNAFKVPEGHTNPYTMPLATLSTQAARVTLGTYVVPPSLVSKLQTDPQLLPITPAVAAAAGTRFHQRAWVEDNVLYVGDNPKAPQVGDMKISYCQASAKIPITIVAQKHKNTFLPFHPEKSTASIYLIEPGVLNVEDMVKTTEKKQAEDLFGKRALAFLMTFLAIVLLGAPISQMFNIIPFLGDVFDSVSTPFQLVFTGLINGVMVAGIWLRYDPIFACLITLGIWVTCLGLILVWKLGVGLLRRLGLVPVSR